MTFDEIVRQAYLENVDRGDMELLKVIEKVFYNASGDGGGDSEDYSGVAFFDNSNTFAEVQAAIDDGKLPILKFYIMGAPAYFYCCEHSTVWIDFVSFSGLVKYQLRWDSNGNKQLSSHTLVSNQSPHFYGNPTAATQDTTDASTKLATTSFVHRVVNDAVADIAISGISEPIKQALLQLARKVVYIDDDGQTYYDALYDALYPPINVDSISAVWNPPSGYVVYSTDSLDSLKAYLTVTATYDDDSTAIIDSTDYVLSGTLDAGTSVITVTYWGITTTFNVTVVSNAVESISAVFAQGNNVIYNTDNLSDLVQYLTVTATYTNLDTLQIQYPDYTLSGTLTVGTSTITVSYENQTDTFNVTVTNYWSWEYDSSVDGTFDSQSYVYKSTETTGVTSAIADDLWNVTITQASTEHSLQLRYSNGSGVYTASQGELRMHIKFASLPYSTGTSSVNGVRTQITTGSAAARFICRKTAADTYKISTSHGASIVDIQSISLNTWYTISIKFTGNQYKIYLNGTEIHSSTSLGTNVASYCGLYLICPSTSSSLSESLSFVCDSIKYRAGAVNL